ncbi:MAG: hypothetical protein ABJ308_04010 [Halieaceae bacterium]
MIQRALLSLALLLLLACGEEPPKAPVTPLSAETEALQQLYKWGVGPFAVEAASGLQIEQAGRDEPLSFAAWYPQAPAAGSSIQWPVLLFSHGNWSSNSKYDNLIRHWVSHGYVVLAPRHLDADGGYLSGTVDLVRYGNLGLIQARVDDLVLLLDNFEQVEQQLPELAGRLDQQRIAATGHSFGAFNAQQLGGATAFDTELQAWVAARDQRIKAVVAISPPGPMFDEIADGSWDRQTAPTLMTTGTWDTNAAFWPDWQMHKLSFETAPPGDQYALVVQGADHYLGNLICRPELEQPPQEDALAMINTTVVAFLDAYLQDNEQALQFLQSEVIATTSGQFALLEYR